MRHIFSQYAVLDPDVRRCMQLAARTWETQNWENYGVPDDSLDRFFKEDGKRIPYVHDVINKGTENLPDSDIAVYTNTDIQVRSDAWLRIAWQMQHTDALYCFRRDFPPKLTHVVPDDDYIKGHDYPGSDLYAFRVGWWRRARKDFPDFLLGYELWDAVLRVFIDETNQGKPTAMRDLIAHEKNGASWWEKPENRYRLNGQIHNLQIGVAWLARRGIAAKNFGVPHDFLTRGKRR
jgi:hypothetical protein